MMVLMGWEGLMKELKDKVWSRCWNEKVVGKKEDGTNEGSYASRCVIMMVQMTLLCVGLGLTPAYLLLRGQLGHSLDMWSP